MRNNSDPNLTAHMIPDHSIAAQLVSYDSVGVSGTVPIRTFTSGATRDQDQTKLDFEGFFSPLVMRRFAEYMHKCRTLPDGSLRASDNWQKGIPTEVYMKSAFRHFMAVWQMHRGEIGEVPGMLPEELCALLFNVMGYLHEVLK